MKTYSSNKFDRSNRRSCFSNYRNDSKNVWRRFNYGLYQNSICNLWYYDYPWLHTYVRITGNQRSKLSRNDIRRKSVWKGSFYSKIKGVKTFFFQDQSGLLIQLVNLCSKKKSTKYNVSSSEEKRILSVNENHNDLDKDPFYKDLPETNL